MLPTLACPVRACGAPLERNGPRHACPQGHSFDVARSGYLNLLQPDHSRSRQPGDSAEAVAARRRTLEAGHAGLLVDTLRAVLSARRVRRKAALDVGCGEGYFAREALAATGFTVAGVDISQPAIEAAARRLPEATWIVANADRCLPWLDGSFDVVTSITARVNPAEFARVLAPEGLLVVGVPAPEDLIELRALVQGAGLERERLPGLLELLGPTFSHAGSARVAWRRELTRAAALDVLASTYRGARERERERAEELPPTLDVTFATDLAWFVAQASPLASSPA